LNSGGDFSSKLQLEGMFKKNGAMVHMLYR